MIELYDIFHLDNKQNKFSNIKTVNLCFQIFYTTIIGSSWVLNFDWFLTRINLSMFSAFILLDLFNILHINRPIVKLLYCNYKSIVIFFD